MLIHIFTTVILPVILSFTITAMVIPCWIMVCHKWHLFEHNDDRKQHRYVVPTMGGLAIYAGITIPFIFLGNEFALQSVHALIGASLILFFTGFFDDLLDLPAKRKLLLQMIAAFFIAWSGLKISNLWGLFGIHEIPESLQIPLTVIFITGITNAYNLIDGLDGLAACLGLMASLLFGTLLFANGQRDFALLSFCLVGSLIGFLKFNFHPARIFMGDTGSLLLGFLLSAQALVLLSPAQNTASAFLPNHPLLVITALFIPVYDVLRVSVIRILTGNSPLKADRNHVHHMIYRTGFGQRSTALLIVAINLGFVAIAMIFPRMNINLFLILSICLGMLMLNMRFMTLLANFYGRIGGRLHRSSVHSG